MKIAELQKKTTVELEERLNELVRDAFTYRVQKANNLLKQTHLMKETRRDVARIMMLLKEKAGE